MTLEPNPTDSNYEALKCEIEDLDASHSEYEMVAKYFATTCRNSGTKVVDIFKIKREGEDARNNPLKLGNKKLLWHGSRFSNFVGILSNGMRIAPPEAPSTGYNYGKGVYFADLADKSVNYCCTHLSKGIGLFVVCEVALGNPQQFLSPNYDAATLPPGCHSTHAVGRLRP